jgi:Probable cobalt transporter subunit (CbtA)
MIGIVRGLPLAARPIPKGVRCPSPTAQSRPASPCRSPRPASSSLRSCSVAGVLAFVVAYVVGEPQIQRAIDFENAAGPALVSRGVQRSIGLLTGSVVLGATLGGFFALVFAWAYGRVGTFGPRALAALLGAGAFLTITLVPFTKYPANPPGVGDPDTIDRRTLLFVAMIVISLLAIAAFIAVIAVAQLILPAVHETPSGFPADVLYRFRLASLGINLTLWIAIGLGFGAAAERVLSPSPVASRAPGSVTVPTP